MTIDLAKTSGWKPALCRNCGKPFAGDDHVFTLPNGSKFEISEWTKREVDEHNGVGRRMQCTRYFSLYVWPPGCEDTAAIQLTRKWAAEAMCRALSGSDTPKLLPGPRWGE